MKNKKSNLKKKTKKTPACKGIADDNGICCQAFKNECDELDKAWRQNEFDRETIEKLINEKTRLKDEIFSQNMLLSGLKIEQKLNMKDEKSGSSEKLNEMVQYNKKLAKDMVRLQAKLDKEREEHEYFRDSWEKSYGDLMYKYNGEVNTLGSKIYALEQQNEKLKASSKEASKVLEQKQLEAKSQLKLKNDQKRELEAKIKTLETKEEECPICFEPISIDRKWTAFIPCGHRTCSECADKIAALPRSTNKRKCPNCRENIIGFLVLEGVYES